MSLWRLLWLELRRNAMPWMFPLLAALFVFNPFRTAMGYGRCGTCGPRSW